MAPRGSIPPGGSKLKGNMIHNSNWLQPFVTMYGLDYMRVTYPISTYDQPNLIETRYDQSHCLGDYKQTKREFDCPRVDFSYKGKRYFGYVPVTTQVKVQKSWYNEQHKNILNEDVMLGDLKKMIEDFIQDIDNHIE